MQGRELTDARLRERKQKSFPSHFLGPLPTSHPHARIRFSWDEQLKLRHLTYLNPFLGQNFLREQKQEEDAGLAEHKLLNHVLSYLVTTSNLVTLLSFKFRHFSYCND